MANAMSAIAEGARRIAARGIDTVLVGMGEWRSRSLACSQAVHACPFRSFRSCCAMHGLSSPMADTRSCRRSLAIDLASRCPLARDQAQRIDRCVSAGIALRGEANARDARARRSGLLGDAAQLEALRETRARFDLGNGARTVVGRARRAVWGVNRESGAQAALQAEEGGDPAARSCSIHTTSVASVPSGRSSKVRYAGGRTSTANWSALGRNWAQVEGVEISRTPFAQGVEGLVHVAPDYGAHVAVAVDRGQELFRILESDLVQPAAGHGDRVMVQAHHARASRPRRPGHGRARPAWRRSCAHRPNRERSCREERCARRRCRHGRRGRRACRRARAALPPGRRGFREGTAPARRNRRTGVGNWGSPAGSSWTISPVTSIASTGQSRIRAQASARLSAGSVCTPRRDSVALPYRCVSVNWRRRRTLIVVRC